MLILPACQKLSSIVACPVEPLPLVTGSRFGAEQLPMEKVGRQCVKTLLVTQNEMVTH